MAAIKSQGVGIFLLGTASPQVYAEVPDVVSISGPTGTAGEIDVTALDSTAREFLISLPDEGSVDLELIWGGKTSNVAQNALRTARANQTLNTFQIRLSDSPQTKYTFTAYVTGWALSAGVDDAVKASVSLRITGPVAAS